ERARRHLASLRDRRTGVYHVSRANHSALFMDNVEVYESLQQVAAAQARFGNAAASADSRAEAEQLARAIRKGVWNQRAQWFVPSNQRTRPAFYPDVFAQVYPWLADLPTAEGDPQQAWSRWKKLFLSAWLENRYDPHAWGLVAVAAHKLGDAAVA